MCAASSQLSLTMPSATSNSQTSRIPAWKRLGLKLKSEQGATVIEQPKEADTPKRKRTDTPEEVVSAKKAKKSQFTALPISNPSTPHLVRKKSVTFTPETKIDDGDSIKQLFNSWATEQKAQDPSFELKTSSQVFDTPDPVQVEEHIDPSLPEKERRVKRVKISKEVNESRDKSTLKKSKSKKEFKVAQPAKPSPPFLSFLRQYSEDRSNWKFNKNHQTHIIKNIFDLEVIPSDHAHFIYEYVRGLQGGVRTRLRDAALSIKVKDQEEGTASYLDTMAEDMIKKKQLEYDFACADYVAQMTEVNASKRMGYEEGILLGLSDFGMRRRFAKRTRAEQILADLPASEGAVGGNGTTKPGGVNGDDDSQKRLRMNNGSSQKVARKRKQRTMVEDIDISSSDETSDSDSDVSSSGDEESEPPTRAVQYNADDTSSSSSSSSSDEDSDSQEDSEGSSESDSD